MNAAPPARMTPTVPSAGLRPEGLRQDVARNGTGLVGTVPYAISTIEEGFPTGSHPTEGARWLTDRSSSPRVSSARNFGDVHALQGIDLEVEPGTVFGVLGPNGAGKTTGVRILTTLLEPDGGRGEVAGLDVVRDAEALRVRIGLAGQYAAVDENLTGLENLVMVGRLYHLPLAEAAASRQEVLERFGLATPPTGPARTYSGGMRRRLDLAAIARRRAPRSCSSTSPPPASTPGAG